MTYQTRVSYPADGSTPTRSFQFPYELAEHVAVYNVTSAGAFVPMVVGVDYVFTSRNIISWLPGRNPTAGYILIKRETPRGVDLLNAPATLSADNLNNVSTRLLYISQEVEDEEEELRSRSLKLPFGLTASDLPPLTGNGGKVLGLDGSDNFIFQTAGGADSALRTDLAGNNGGSFVGFLKAFTGALKRSVASLFLEKVSLWDFNVKADATFDIVSRAITGTVDNAGVQACIDAAMLTVPPSPINWPQGKLCRITQPLKINNPLFQGSSIPLGRPYLHIYMNGGGIIRDGDFPLFDTDLVNLADSTAPSSQYIMLHEPHIIAPDPTAASPLFAPKIHRSMARAGRLDGIKFIATTGYAQDMRLLDNVISGVKGAVMRADTFLFSCDVVGNNFEGCEDGIQTGIAIYSVTARNVFESSRRFWKSLGGIGSHILHNKLEGNSDVDIQTTDAGGGEWKGGSVKGNTHIYLGVGITGAITSGSTSIAISSVDRLPPAGVINALSTTSSISGIPDGTTFTPAINGPGTYTMSHAATATKTTSGNVLDPTFFSQILGYFQGVWKGNYSSWNLLSKAFLVFLPRAIDLEDNYAEREIMQGGGTSAYGGINLFASDRSASDLTRHFGKYGHSKFAARLNQWFRWGIVGSESVSPDGQGAFPGYAMSNPNGDGTEVIVFSLPASPATVAPASHFVKGSLCFNTSGDLGSPVGWICAATGTPGTWTAFGPLGQVVMTIPSNSVAAPDVATLETRFNALLAALRTAKLG